MNSNYSNVQISFTGEEFKAFKQLMSRFYSLLLVPASRMDDFYDGLKNLDIDVASSLVALKLLVDDNYSTDLEITKFLQQLKDL